jgi:hypothetical protein
MSVTGKVLDYNGQPAAFLPVLVGGKVTSTDDKGNFSALGSAAPISWWCCSPPRNTPKSTGGQRQKGEASLFTQQFGVAPDATGVNLLLPQPIEQLQLALS